jgi:hypothetical protein
MFKTLLILAATGSLAAQALRRWRAGRPTPAPAHGTAKLARAALQRWEDEGGQLPTGDAAAAATATEAAPKAVRRTRARRATSASA